MLLACQPLGAIEMDQEDQGGKREKTIGSL